jgi:hypothetical protein
VVGGELDRLITPATVAATAACYGVAPTIVRGVAHNAMLDLHWRDAAIAVLEAIRPMV